MDHPEPQEQPSRETIHEGNKFWVLFKQSPIISVKILVEEIRFHW